ncbi:MAG: response regulator [Rhodopila sp.]|nr:response regulator [Rhodopila sp.]
MDAMFSAAHQGAPRWQMAQSDENKGPTENGAAGKPRQDAMNFSAMDASASRRRILIVDDNESVRETLAEVLEVVGFCPVQAADAVEALMILRQESAIDALVTDLTMPGADGITLIRQAREINKDLPAILLTGYAEQVTSVATIAGGNFHVLRKPVEGERLIEQITLLLKTLPGT